MGVAAVFRGDTAQMRALLSAIEHNCTCATGSCPAHRMLLEQHLLDRLLFARWLRTRLWDEEVDHS